ncbi:hypothetical protein RCL1_002421 [Eukaryota sp. TZLM3-RCL]
MDCFICSNAFDTSNHKPVVCCSHCGNTICSSCFVKCSFCPFCKNPVRKTPILNRFLLDYLTSSSRCETNRLDRTVSKPVRLLDVGSFAIFYSSDPKAVYARGCLSDISLDKAFTFSEPIIEQSVGKGHCLFLSYVGNLYSMGVNTFGQLGTTDTNMRLEPVLIADLVTCISAGAFHSAAISHGRVFTWGCNQYSQLGIGRSSNRVLPVAAVLPSNLTFISVACGYNFTVALTKCGRVFSWLCDGTFLQRDYPVLVEGLENVEYITTGWYHVIAICKTGKVYSWGRNDYGQLGIGNSLDQCLPHTLNFSTPITHLAAGNFHSIALDEKGTVFSWGCNESGQLGLGEDFEEDVLSPKAVTFSDSYQVVDVKAGCDFSIVVDSSQQLWVCGSNEYQQFPTNKDVLSGYNVLSFTKVLFENSY